MKLSSIALLATMLFYGACMPNLERRTLTANEDKGIKESIAFYGGQCEYGIKKTVSTKEKENGTTFWINFSKSAVIDSLEEMAELPGSNIAYLFYKNLNQEERSRFINIKSELVFSDKTSSEFIYTVDKLEKVKSKVPLAEKIVELIKAKKFDDLRAYVNADTALVDYKIDTLIANLRKIELKAGKIERFILYGFKFHKAANGREILRLAGLIKREGRNHYFTVLLDPNTPKEEVYSLNYTL